MGNVDRVFLVVDDVQDSFSVLGVFASEEVANNYRDRKKAEKLEGLPRDANDWTVRMAEGRFQVEAWPLMNTAPSTRSYWHGRVRLRGGSTTAGFFDKPDMWEEAVSESEPGRLAPWEDTRSEVDHNWCSTEGDTWIRVWSKDNGVGLAELTRLMEAEIEAHGKQQEG